MTRKIVLGLGVALLTFGFLGSDAEAKSKKSKKSKKGEFTLRIMVDDTTFDTTGSGLGGAGFGAFHVQGDICKDPTGVGACMVIIGEYHCWGWIPPNGVGLVLQEYNLFDRGKIQLQGIEDGPGPRAVVGGTGDFREVRGQTTGGGLANFPEFTIDFKLKGVKK